MLKTEVLIVKQADAFLPILLMKEEQRGIEVYIHKVKNIFAFAEILHIY